MLLIKAFDVGHKMCSKHTNVKLFKILKQIRKHGSGIQVLKGPQNDDIFINKIPNMIPYR